MALRRPEEAAQRLDDLEDLAFHAEVIVLDDAGRGIHFPADLEQHLRDVNLQPGEVPVFQRTMQDQTLLWFMDSHRSIVYKLVLTFTTNISSQIRDRLWTWPADPDSAVATAPSFPLGEAGEVVGEILAELDGKLASPIVETLQKMGARMAFLVAGTEITSLPIDSCESWRRSKINLSYLPGARGLGFSRAGKYVSPDVPYLHNRAGRLRLARTHARQREQRGLVVADPTGTLKYAHLEAAVVALEANRFSMNTLSGSAANESILSEAAGDVGLFHLISHGEFDEASPYRSGIYAAEADGSDGMWMVAEVFGDVKAVAGRLAFLSACDTGRVRPNVVSEDISLPSAFLAAGFSAVVATRWAIDDLSTALLVGEFYRCWGTGQVGVSEALRQTVEWLRGLDKLGCRSHLKKLGDRLKQLKSPVTRKARQTLADAMTTIENGDNRPFANPRHWAAFHVVGDGNLTSACLPSQRLKPIPARSIPGRHHVGTSSPRQRP